MCVIGVRASMSLTVRIVDADFNVGGTVIVVVEIEVDRGFYENSISKQGPGGGIACRPAGRPAGGKFPRCSR